MNNRFQAKINATGTMAWSVFILLGTPGSAASQPQGGGNPGLQPALILALALTSLVLFLIYLFQKYKTQKKKAAEPKRWTTEDNPLHTRLNETHKALNALMTHPGIPMAKTDLEQGRILDATPALYRTLGYSRRDFLKLGPEAAGLLPTDKGDIRRIIEDGWAQTRGMLSQKNGEVRLDCHIVNIATHLDGHPTVLSIIPDLGESGPLDQPAGPSQHVDDFN